MEIQNLPEEPVEYFPTHRLHLKDTRNLEFDRTPSQDLQYEYGDTYSFQQKITALRQPSSKVSNKWQLKTSTWPYHDTVNFLLAVAVLIISGTQHIRSTAVWACPVTQSCPISCIAK